ncbi:hypothetical protein GDO78_002125 [Eleutherodactylus coqui]|uniref:Flap endonuclease GEN homolog 1 n=1 Tax=Eleutherodactylus coqui TaxID=57060 RepID=A0A8J6FUU1_ELECQ|nr:hypothetical protein GDO78_002125 [Eleutherodactylus coqui]
MGVHELWQILEPVKKHVSLQSLSGKTLAVDLSIWVCEAQSVKQMIGVVAKPHLRNLFFRVSSLNLMGVKLVFVTEGQAPKVKADTMNKRNALRYGATKKTVPARPGRSYFKSVLKECLRMLDCLGVPWVQAAGEAEAMCAYLDANGYVDGCITNDGDVFLYGARTVYRNFTMNVKDPHVDCYEVSAIKDRLGLDRESLVGLAIFLGCDYIPKGLPGVGRELAMKFIKSLNGESILQRFYQWRKQFDDPTMNSKPAKKKVHCTVCSHPGSEKEHERKGCTLCGSEKYCEPHDYDYCCPCDWHKAKEDKKNSSLEYTLKMKAKKCEGFPYPEVIKEFLVNKDKLVKVMKWIRPSLLCFQIDGHKVCYLSYRIVKTRIRNGIPCLEIEWVKPDGYIFPDEHPPGGPLLTIEEECLFAAAYPHVVELFQEYKLEAEMLKQKCKKNKPKTKVPPNVDDVASLLSEMSLAPTIETKQSPLGTSEEPETTTRLQGRDQSKDLPGTTGLSPSMVNWVSGDIESSSRPLCIEDDVVRLDEQWSSLNNTQKSSVASPVSSVVEDLHLSSIDWDAISFTMSPHVGTGGAQIHGVQLSQNTGEPIKTTNSVNNPTQEIPELIKDAKSEPLGLNNEQESSVASPNVSSVIADLHLSSIDWEAISFSMSPHVESRTGSGQTHCAQVGPNIAEPIKPTNNVNNPSQEIVEPFKDAKSEPLGLDNKQDSLVASPNVSSVIADLHLSRIDWEAISFSMSPHAESHIGDGQTHGVQAGPNTGEPIKATNNVNPTQEIIEPSRNTNSERLALAASPYLARLENLPLRERLLLKNARQYASSERANVLQECLPIKPISRSLNKRDTTTFISNHTVNSKENVVTYKQTKSTKEQSSQKSEKQINATRRPEHLTSKSFTFVKKIPFASLRPLSEGSISSKKAFAPLTKVAQKKSVCLKMPSSSEDEGEQGTSGRPKHVFKKERAKSEMPVNIMAPVRPANNLQPDTFGIPSIDIVLDNVFSSPEAKVLPAKSLDELNSDDDDSIISVDSPLPLAERLKLRQLQNS